MSAASMQTWFEVQRLHAEVASALDTGDYARWPDWFTEDGCYRVQSRENFDRGFPLATIDLESRAMMRDRVVGATDTIFHRPYYQRHVIGPPLIFEDAGDTLRCESSYLVIRTHHDGMPEVLSVGRYLDRLLRVEGAWKFRERIAVFDNDLLPNSLIYPI